MLMRHVFSYFFLLQVKLPCKSPCSCAIGGKEMDTLFITTDSRYLKTEDERATQPGAGMFF
jgi:sugar lactone lactonase YvrE